VVGIGRLPPSAGPARGEVYLVEFEDIGGSVLRGPHPALVVQTDRMGRSSMVFLCPISSRGSRVPDYVPPYLAWVARRESGLDRDGWVKADQLFTRPTDSLGPRIGRLSPAAMTRVDASLRFVLGL
jgi:mRNA-degrading endonuclease toxin of MazEF toxin-antitoxin module